MGIGSGIYFLRSPLTRNGLIMLYGLLADVHGNLHALEAALRHLTTLGADRVVVSGDLVGYSANPGEVMELLRRIGARCVAGNHEKMVTGELSPARCVRSGIRAVHWTRRHLSPLQLQWLVSLPTHRAVGDGLLLAHGSLDSVEEYVDNPASVGRAFARMRTLFPRERVLVLGHTHRQGLYLEDGRWLSPDRDSKVTFGEVYRAIINPGAVGQSRDDQLLVRFALFDSESLTVHFKSVAYDFRKTVESNRAAGLHPELCWTRRTPLQRRFDQLANKATRWWAMRRPLPALGDELPGIGLP